MEGVGWIFVGDKDDAYKAIYKLKDDSDRAVGVLAAAIVEVRLTAIIREVLAKPPSHEDHLESLFGKYGALSNFEPKIDLGYLLNLFSETAKNDLEILVRIRNDFAHRLDVLDFGTDSIKDRCFNLKLVDKEVAEVSLEELLALEKELLENPKKFRERGGPSHRFSGATKARKDPRQRYIMTTQLLANAFGAAHNNPHAAFPVI